MRIVFAMLINIAFIGGLALYMSHRDKSVMANPALLQKTQIAKKKYRLEITPAFVLQPDRFAIQDNSQKPALLSVRMGSNEILRRTESVEPGKSITVNVSGFVEGDNELYIQASPPTDDRYHALRVRILQDGQSMADTTFWAEPGMLISDAFYFHIGSTQNEAHHD